MLHPPVMSRTQQLPIAAKQSRPNRNPTLCRTQPGLMKGYGKHLTISQRQFRIDNIGRDFACS